MIDKGRKYFVHLGILFSCYLALLFFFESSLHLGLFVPIAPSLAKIGSLTDWLTGLTNIFTLKSLIRSLFAATALVLVVQIFKEKSV